MKAWSHFFLRLTMIVALTRGAGIAGAGAADLAGILEPTRAVAARLAAAHGLGRDLSAPEVRVLLKFLTDVPGPREANPPALQVLKNDIMNALQDQAAPPAGLTEALTAIWENQSQDATTRDYALQHLSVWYERGLEPAPEIRAQIRNLLKTVAEEPCDSAGTALLALERISQMDPALDGREVSRLALAAAANEFMPVAARISAMQVCAERRLREALPIIRRLVEHSKSVALRISAIGALGILGDSEDLARLKQLAKEHNTALQPALAAAARALEHGSIEQPLN